MSNLEDRVWTAVGKWAKCGVWRTSLTKTMGMEQFRPFEAVLHRNDHAASIANLYEGKSVVEENGCYMIDAIRFYLLRDWSVKMMVPHVWFIALHDEDADDTFMLYQKAWPPNSGLRYEHTVKIGPPQLLIPKGEFKPCEVTT